MRVKDSLSHTYSGKCVEGSLLHSITRPPPMTVPDYVRRPIYQKEAYLALLEKNCKEMGIPCITHDIPEYVPKVKKEVLKEPRFDYIDQVQVRLVVLKSGIIRVKMDTSFMVLHEKYYSQYKLPPVKSILKAYKSMGYSEKFLERTKNNFTKKIEHAKKVSGIIDSIFNKEPVKKPKKKVVSEELPDEIEVLDEPDEPEDPDDPDEDGGMDVDLDEDPDEQPQEDEEEYLSD